MARSVEVKIVADSLYDSRVDTYEHINRVRLYLDACIVRLLKRGQEHDASKLFGIEKEAFDKATPRLKDIEYGSDEYRATLREIRPAIDAHYAANSHHPEHYGERGVSGMSLFDVLEMLCDWKAAGERHANGGNILRSIEINKERWGISDELTTILVNTAKEFGWISASSEISQ